jgi:Flp pilus assembly protein TadG
MTLSFNRAFRDAEKRRGVAAAELALLLPLLLFCSMAVVDFACLVYAQVTLQNCARNGAIYEFYTKSGFPLPTSWTNLSNAVVADAPNLTVNNMTSSVYSPGSSTNNYVTVTVTYPYALRSLAVVRGLPSIPSSITLTQSATMPFPALISAP